MSAPSRLNRVAAGLIGGALMIFGGYALVSGLITGAILHPARRAGSASIAWSDDQAFFMLLVLIYAAIMAFGAFALRRSLRPKSRSVDAD